MELVKHRHIKHIFSNTFRHLVFINLLLTLLITNRFTVRYLPYLRYIYVVSTYMYIYIYIYIYIYCIIKR